MCAVPASLSFLLFRSATFTCYSSCVLQYFFPVSAGGVVTLTSSTQSAICLAEEVILTCTVTGGVSLEWSSTAFSPVIRYREDEPVGRMVNRGIFTATLTSESENFNPSLSDLTSTLRVTATPEAVLNGTVVTCSDQLNPVSVTLTLAGVFIHMHSVNTVKVIV